MLVSCKERHPPVHGLLDLLLPQLDQLGRLHAGRDRREAPGGDEPTETETKSYLYMSFIRDSPLVCVCMNIKTPRGILHTHTLTQDGDLV